MMHACNPLSDKANVHLIDVLRRHAAQTPDRRALAFLDPASDRLSDIDYATLDRRARAIAARLQRIRAEGRPALLLFPPGPDFVLAFLGCLYAGVTAVPSYVPRRSRSRARLEAIAREAEISLVLTTGRLLAELYDGVKEIEPLAQACWMSTDTLSDVEADRWNAPACSAETLACLQYTSGSTAAPKGVMLTHGNLIANNRVIQRAFGHTPESRGVIWLPPYHDMGLIGGILQPLLVGFPTILMSPFDTIQRPLRWLTAITEHRATTSGGPNFAFDLCVDRIRDDELDSLDLSSWRVAFNGAEPVRERTLQRFADRFESCGFSCDAFFPCYGLAEATLYVAGGHVMRSQTFGGPSAHVDSACGEPAAGGPVTDTVRSYVSCGPVASELRVAIVDPQTRERMGEGELGEIWVAGDSNAAGYWRRPAETNETFRATISGGDGTTFLRSGDSGAIRNGELYVTGRLKDLIIVDGRNHHAEDIEQTVQQCHAWLRAHRGAVFAIGADCSTLTVVHELPRDRLRESCDAVLQAISASVAREHELSVAAIHLVKPGAVPKTPSGKIQRRLCRAQLLAGELDAVVSWSRQHDGSTLSSQPPSPENVPGQERAEERETASRTPAMPARQRHSVAEIREWLRRRVARKLQWDVSQINIHQALADYGFTSRDAVEMSAELEDQFQCRLSPTILYDHPSIERLATFLSDRPTGARSSDTVRACAERAEDPIAIVGIGCRFPGASSPREFWQMLVAGADMISHVPQQRWKLPRQTASAGPHGTSPNGTRLHALIRQGGWLADIDRFDPTFFGISPREARLIDPQQKLLLEVAWETFEDIGLPPSVLRGSRTGVWVGSATNDYRQELYGRTGDLDPYWCTGNANSIVANRLSYVFDLCGPSMTIDTACSSSLVAVHLACRSLRTGESDLALAGGANLILSPDVSISFAKAGGLAADGRCKAFDARADGIVRSEGVGLIALKRLSDAEADGDMIYAVIRGSAVNQDGRSNGITAPSQSAQTAVVCEAWRDAGLQPADADYIETHGAGTLLGDVIEAHALGRALGAERHKAWPCMIGSVKTNFGHCEAAAGVAGLIKVALAMHHGQLPGSLHFRQPNPNIRFQVMPFAVQTNLGPWPSRAEPRLAGVSSFGFGGANAHVVLESYTARSAGSLAQPSALLPTHVLPLSAAREADLAAVARAMNEFVSRREQLPLGNLCLAAATRRERLRHRVAIDFTSRQELLDQLELLENDPQQLQSSVVTGTDAADLPLAFVFAGHGGLRPGAHAEWMRCVAAFRARLYQCDKAIQQYAGWSVLDALDGRVANWETDMELSHTCMFAFQVAQAAALQFFGPEPAAITGHSMGEVAASHVAGALTLQDAVRMVVQRSRVLNEALANAQDAGAMAALKVSAEQIEQPIRDSGGELVITVTNSPCYTVVSGPRPKLEKLLKELRAKRIAGRMMDVPGAAHTPALAPMADVLRERLAGLQPQPTTVPFYSTQLARRCDGRELTADYWAASIYQPVQFAAVIGALLEEQLRDFVELGPLAKLTSAITQSARAAQLEVTAMPLHARDDHELRTLAIALGRLHCRGSHVRWSRFYHGDATSVRLPTYPWQRERCWIDAPVTPLPDAVPDTPDPTGHVQQQPVLAPQHGDPRPAIESCTDNVIPQRSAAEQITTTATVNDAVSSRVTSELAPEELRGVPEEDRQRVLQTYLSRQVARTLDVEPSTIGLREPLTHLGIDSLMAIEVKNRIESELGVKISIGQFLEGPTISGLTAMLLPQLDEPGHGTAEHDVVTTGKEAGEPELSRMSRSQIETLLSQVDQLSDEQIDALLLQVEDNNGGEQ